MYYSQSTQWILSFCFGLILFILLNLMFGNPSIGYVEFISKDDVKVYSVDENHKETYLGRIKANEPTKFEVSCGDNNFLFEKISTGSYIVNAEPIKVPCHDKKIVYRIKKICDYERLN